MKKLSIFLALVIAISACLPLVIGASDADTITKSEAQELVSKAFGFSENVRGYSWEDKTPTQDYDKSIEVYVDSIGEYATYYKVIEANLPGGSFDAMKKYAETIYSKKVAPYAYEYSAGYGTLPTPSNLLNFAHSSFFTADKHRPLFYTDPEGLLYSAVLGYQIGFSFALLNDNDEEQAIYNFNLTDNVALEIVSGDAVSATALVSFIWCKMEDTPPFDIQTVECKFVKTSEGWRIDESEYSVLCATSSKDTLAAYRSAVSPSTGDSAGERVAVIGAVSLACIIPTACLMRRRRRASAE